MLYIDSTYYYFEYMGVPVADPELLERLIFRASDDIDILTRYRITNFESQPEFIQQQVKKAVAVQVEHLYKQEDSDSFNTTIGKFKYTSESKQISDEKFAPSVFEFLSPTGLLYAGLGVIQ